MRIDCPICNKTIADAPDDFAARPFCSARCKLVDLGNWFNESYRVPVADEDAGGGDVPRGDDHSIS